MVIVTSIIFLFSFGIMRKEEEEMWLDSTTFAIILFVVWIVFGWAYLSECDRWMNGDDDDED